MILFIVAIATGVGGMLIGYSLRDTIRYAVHTVHGMCYRFWHYTICKEPEPDWKEVMVRTLPPLISGIVSMKVVNDIAEEFEKAVNEIPVKRKK